MDLNPPVVSSFLSPSLPAGLGTRGSCVLGKCPPRADPGPPLLSITRSTADDKALVLKKAVWVWLIWHKTAKGQAALALSHGGPGLSALICPVGR